MAGSFDSGDVWNSNGRYYVRVYGSWWDDPGNNRSYVYVNAQYGGASGWWFCDHDVSGALYVNGGAVVGYGGRYCMAGAGSRNQLQGWEGYIGHDGNTGSGSFSASVTFGMVNQSYSYSMRSVSAGSGGTFTNYDRRVTTPATPSLSRSSDGSSITMSTSVSTQNGGPNADYFHWYFSTDNSNWTFLKQTNPTTTNATSFTWANGNGDQGRTPDPLTRYYFIAYAHNADSNNNNGWTANSSSNNLYGVPSAPRTFTATVNTTDSGKIDCSWVIPSNTQGDITGYDVYVGGTKVNTSNITGTSYAVTTTDGTTPLSPGTDYSIYVIAKNATGFNNSESYSRSGSLTRKAPGAPAAPTLPATYTSGAFTYTNPSKMGRNVTILCNATPNDYGIAINTSNAEQGYFVQYKNSTEENGTYGAWSTPVKMSDQANRTHTFPLMDPARWYKFRIYAANTIANNSAGTKTYYPHNLGSTANFSVETAPFFVPAAGKRYDGTEYLITNIAKRYNPITSAWQDISIAKRYNAVQGVWEDLT